MSGTTSTSSDNGTAANKVVVVSVPVHVPLVAFTLGGSKKKKSRGGSQAATAAASTSLVASEFGASQLEDHTLVQRKRTTPLVIPLPEKNRKSLLPSSPTKQNDNGNDNDNDNDKAAQALLKQEAAQHYMTKKEDTDDGTNFSSKGSLVIASKGDTFKDNDNDNNINNKQDTETDQFRKDLDALPQDIPVQSSVYENVPITEFGAAMLRGMGWKGNHAANSNSDAKKKNSKDDFAMPRPHRLGLGATPKLTTTNNNTHKMRRPDQVKRDKQREEQYREFETKRLAQVGKDNQRTLQNQSIVTIVNNAIDSYNAPNTNNNSSRRAKMIKMAGVPGLNQVLIQYEGQDETVSIKKSEVRLVDRSELDNAPYCDVALKPILRNEQRTRTRTGSPEKDQQKMEYDRRDAPRDRDRDRKRDRDSENRDHNHHRSNRDRADEGDRDRSHRRPDQDRDKRREEDSNRRRRENNEDRDHDRRSSKRKSRSQEREEASSHSRERKQRRRDEHGTTRNSNNYNSNWWLLPNIRVRLVTKKFASHQYNQKGLVLDVMHGGASAILQMADGQVLDRVADRYLETALPKVNGNAIVLTGPHKGTKGKLLERNSERAKGLIQVFEDMSVLTVSLDDMAEWCGPLDDDDME